MNKTKKVSVYTDGSADNRNAPNFGGYGVLLMHRGMEKEISEPFYKVTSNAMELMAIIRALEEVKPGFHIIIKSDSAYCVNSITKKWLFDWESANILDNKTNGKLWKRFLQAYRRHPFGYVTVKHVKGHAGEEFNERVDKLANGAFKKRVPRELKEHLYDRDKVMIAKDPSWKVEK